MNFAFETVIDLKMGFCLVSPMSVRLCACFVCIRFHLSFYCGLILILILIRIPILIQLQTMCRKIQLCWNVARQAQCTTSSASELSRWIGGWVVVYRHKLVEQRYVWHDPSKNFHNKQSIEDVCWAVACAHESWTVRISLLLVRLPGSIQPYISLICSFLAFGWLENMKNQYTLFFRLMWAGTKNHFVSLIFVIFHVLWISDTVNCRNWGSFYLSLPLFSIATPIGHTLQRKRRRRRSENICWLNAKIVVFCLTWGTWANASIWQHLITIESNAMVQCAWNIPFRSVPFTVQ